MSYRIACKRERKKPLRTLLINKKAFIRLCEDNCVSYDKLARRLKLGYRLRTVLHSNPRLMPEYAQLIADFFAVDLSELIIAE